MKHEELPCKGKFCGRKGLPILPLVVSYVPDGEDDLPLGIHASPEFLYQPMQGGRYQLRVITTGFVWIWDPRRSIGWQCFAATPSGRFRELPLSGGSPAEPPGFNCARDGHNLEASLVSIPSPDKSAQTVWIGYSRAWWTDEARARLQSDGAARGRVMMEVDAKAIDAGKVPAAEAGFRVDPAGEKLVQHVLEYRDFAVASDKYAYTTAMAVNRVGEAEDLAQRMQELAPNGGIALALRDPVGITQDISKWRNYCAGKLAEFQLQQKNLREYVVADLITGLRHQLQDAGEHAQWRRYAQHVDTVRVDEFYSNHERKVSELGKPIQAAAADWSWWFRQPGMWAVLDTYDGQDRVVAQQLEEDLAGCIDGAGALASEQTTLDAILKTPLEGEHNALWRAYAGGGDTFLEFLSTALAGTKGLGVFKDVRNLAHEFKQWLREHGASHAAPAGAATAVIGRTLGAQLSRLSVTSPEQASRLRVRVSLIAAARINLPLAVYRYQVSTQELVAELYEANSRASNAPQTSMLRSGGTLWANSDMPNAWLATQIEVEATLTIDLWLPEAVEAELAQAPVPNAAALAPAMRAPLPTPYQGLMKWLRSLDGPIAGLGAVLSVAALTTALQDYQLAGKVGDEEKQKKAAFGIASGAQGLLAVVVESWSGIVNARLGSGLAESVAKERAARLFVHSGVLSLAGGALAFGSAASEGIYLISKGAEIRRSGDRTAAAYYQRSGFLFVAVGVTAAATALIQAGTAFAAAGVTAAGGGLLGLVGGVATSAATVLGMIPVAGWIVLGIAALAAGLYLLFRAKEEEDTAIEQWLSRTILRNEEVYAGTGRKRYESLDDELHQFSQAVFNLYVVFNWIDEIGRDRLILQVVLPGYDASRSRFAYQLTVAGPRKEVLVARRGVALSQDPDLQPRAPVQASVSAAPQQGWLDRQLSAVDRYVERQASKTGWMDAWEWVRAPRNAVDFVGGELEPAVKFQLHQGYALLSTELLVDEDDLFGEGFDRSVLKFEYWPDAVSMPDLKIGAGSNGINYQIEQD